MAAAIVVVVVVVVAVVVVVVVVVAAVVSSSSSSSSISSSRSSSSGSSSSSSSSSSYSSISSSSSSTSSSSSSSSGSGGVILPVSVSEQVPETYAATLKNRGQDSAVGTLIGLNLTMRVYSTLPVRPTRVLILCEIYGYFPTHKHSSLRATYNNLHP